MRSSEWSSEGCSSDLADIVVDGGARDDARELEVVVLVVEARQVELERAVQEGVLRTDLERVDLLGLEGDRHREYRRQRRVDAARFVAARIGHVDQIIGRDLVIEHRAAGEPLEGDLMLGIRLEARDRKSTRLNSSH